MCELRKAEAADLDAIMQVLEQGRLYLSEQGLPQWQNGYGPNRTMAEADVQRGEAYVLTVNGIIRGCAALTAGIDDCYSRIFDGQWDDICAQYVSIHRVAIDPAVRGKGLAAGLMRGLLAVARDMGYRDVRVDTHAQNAIMERVILRAGFQYRGRIMLPMPNGERRAYQVILPEAAVSE